MSITIYHNPSCGTSRNTLAMIRNSGEEPTIIEYLKTPPDRARLKGLNAASGMSARPSELVLDILPKRQLGPFTQEDGENVIDAEGKRVSAK